MSAGKQNAKHTLGPWRINGAAIETADGVFITWINSLGNFHVSTDVANARLIAAAPELLEALQRIAAHWPTTSNPNCDDYTRGYAQAVADHERIARAAIARATG